MLIKLDCQENGLHDKRKHLQTLIFRTRLNSIHCEEQTKAFLLCGRSESGCEVGGWAWNWLRDRRKQNELLFFFLRRRFLKENCNF